MDRHRLLLVIGLIGLAAAVPACARDFPLPSGSAVPDGFSGSADLLRTGQLDVAMTAQNRLDLLFVIDSSDGMELVQAELRNKFGQFFKPLQDLAGKGTFAHLHLAVITGDLGAGVAGAPGCQPQGHGDGGRMRGVGRAAPPGCQPPLGASYIDYAFGPNGPWHSNLPAEEKLLEAFVCMSGVGTSGCRYQQPLEAARAALLDGLPENAGFRQPGDVLVVVFVTNRDDGSLPAGSDLPSNPAYGPATRYQRSTRRGVLCGQPPSAPPDRDSGGPIAGCLPAPNPGATIDRLADVQRYIDAFTRPAAQGGVSVDPGSVFLAAIAGPAAPFAVLQSSPDTPWDQPYARCPKIDPAGHPACLPLVERSCRNPAAGIAAEPAVRLSAVVSAVARHQITSVCENDFAPTLESAAGLLVNSRGDGCLHWRLPRDARDQPVIDCTAEDITTPPGGSTYRTELRRCDPDNPYGPHQAVPCWTVNRQDLCAASPDGLGLTVDRGRGPGGAPNEVPVETFTRVICAIDG